MLQGKYPLLIALVLGLMAGSIAWSAIHHWNVEQHRYWAPTRILCAARDLDEGSELDEDMIDICEIPERYVTDSVLRVSQEETKDEVLPFGQRLLVPVKKGDALLYSQFQASTRVRLSEAVPRWGRAISIDVSEKAAVGRHVQPNDHVDVLATLRDPEGKAPFAITLLVNEIVLAAGSVTGRTSARPDDEGRYTNVTLMVSPEEAEMLALAQEMGTLTLTLRNPESEVERKGLGQMTDFQTLLTEEQNLYKLRLPRQTVSAGGVLTCRGNDCVPVPLQPGKTPL